MMIASQIARFISLIYDNLSAKALDSRRITMYNGVANIFLGISYLFLNALTGAICSFICILRNFIFYKFKNKLPILVLLLYFAIVIALNIKEIHILIDIIPLLLVIIFGSALYYQDPLKIKYAGIIVSLLEIIYDYYYKSYMGIFCCVVYIFVTLISLKERKN